MGYETTTKLWVMSTIPNTLRVTFLPFEDMDMPENEWSKPSYFIDFFREKIGADMYKFCGKIKELEEKHCREYLIRLKEARDILSECGYNGESCSIKENAPHFNKILEQFENILIMDDWDRKYISVYDIHRQYKFFQWLVNKMDKFKEDGIEFFVTMEIT